MNFAFANDFKYCTVRIEIIDNKVNLLGSGTGFFFTDVVNHNEKYSYIITNKHVVAGVKRARILFHTSKEDGNVHGGNTMGMYLDNLDHHWINHPDKRIDLAAFPLQNFLKNTDQIGVKPFFREFSSEQVPDQITIQSFNSIENILMVGYPNTLWDKMNKLPLIRQGITATDPKVDFNWRSEFVIDAACFPGSSGSPVVIYRHDNFNKNGLIPDDTKFFLSGILYAGPQHIAEGKVVIEDIPVRKEMIAYSSIPNNLGFVIKSQRLLDFRHVIPKYHQ